jgi:hypothetical protein
VNDITTNLADYSSGFFAAQVGVPRLLRLFKKHGIGSSLVIQSFGSSPHAHIHDNRFRRPTEQLLWSLPGASATTNLADYSSGFFAAQVGVPRLLRLFKKHGIPRRHRNPRRVEFGPWVSGKTFEVNWSE